MSLKNILTLVQAKTGLNPAEANQRLVMLRYINEAADEIYIQSDIVGSLVEQVFQVNGDQTVAMPSYVGPIRAVREYSTFVPWSLNQMRPRYSQSNWNDFWRNWRLKGKEALMSSITNAGPVTVSTPNTPAASYTVTITGSTLDASYISEDIVMTSASSTGAKNFISIVGVTKSAVTAEDVTITDLDGKVLTVIPNNELAASYQIIDVSACPWMTSTSNPLDHYVEVLYKKALPYLTNDGDEFPAQGFDMIVANKALQIYYQENGNAEVALAYDQLVTRSMARKNEEQNRATEDVIGFVENPHDNMNPRIRARRPGRYGGYSTTSRYGVA